MAQIAETDLYPPVKDFLERLGYVVKAEVGDVDVMAVRGDEPPVVVELKTGFSLTLLHQACARLAVTDSVYVCVPKRSGRASHKALRSNIHLCRRLGLGVMTVRPRDGLVEVFCDPSEFRPRKNRAQKSKLLAEFAKLQGDPNIGGTRGRTMTAYRQDAQSVAKFLRDFGASKGAVVAKATMVKNATRILSDNHYGWFYRVSTGIYDLTDEGRAAVGSFVENFSRSDVDS